MKISTNLTGRIKAMKTINIISAALLLTMASCTAMYDGTSSGYDDVYYSGKDKTNRPQVQNSTQAQNQIRPNGNAENYSVQPQQNQSDQNNYQPQESDNNSGYFSDNEEPGYSDTTNNNSPENTIVNNNYYYDNYNPDDYYDYYYTSRIRRFHNPYYGYSYYDDYYTNSYWYNYDPYNWGVSIYLGYDWWWPSYYYYRPSYYCGWNYPGWGGWYYDYPYYGWGGHYWNNYYGWGSGYWCGYNDGYWNGYYDGYWNAYADNYYNSHDHNSYYYGPRTPLGGNYGLNDHHSGRGYGSTGGKINTGAINNTESFGNRYENYLTSMVHKPGERDVNNSVKDNNQQVVLPVNTIGSKTESPIHNRPLENSVNTNKQPVNTWTNTNEMKKPVSTQLNENKTNKPTETRTPINNYSTKPQNTGKNYMPSYNTPTPVQKPVQNNNYSSGQKSPPYHYNSKKYL